MKALVCCAALAALWGSLPTAAQATCLGGAACITPQTTVNARAATNGAQDVIVGPIGPIVVQNRSLTNPIQCLADGASECIRPMGGSYVVIAYPTATLGAVQPTAGLDVVANWMTTNAAATTLTCAGPLGITLNATVPHSGTNATLAGSNAWPTGPYNCTLLTTNSVGRQATASSALYVTSGLPTGPVGQPDFDSALGPFYCNWTDLNFDPVTGRYDFYVTEVMPGGSRVDTNLGYAMFNWNTVTGVWDMVGGVHNVSTRFWLGQALCTVQR